MPYELEANRPIRDVETLARGLQSRLRELVVCLSHSWGGLEQVAANDAVDRGKLGIDVRVLCLQGSPIHEFLAHRPEVKLVPLEFRPKDYFDLRMRGELIRLFAEGVNLVHAHQTSLLGSITPWLWRRPGIAAFASRHIMNNHDKRDFFHRAVYRRLDALVVMSETLRQNILATHPLRERQVKVVHLGLDFERFDPMRVDPQAQRERWGIEPGTVVVGLVGRIDPAKGQRTFIQAAAGLLGGWKSSTKLKFVLVGEETLGRTSHHLEELRHMVTQFRLDEHVVFAGYQANIPEVMRAFDLMVMPSRQEAFGLVAIEAMAMECPIIISSGGSAQEIVGNHQEFGLLVRPESAFDLQQQMRRLLDTPDERQGMGKRAREHVRSHYDRSERVRRTFELYERALKRRSPWGATPPLA